MINARTACLTVISVMITSFVFVLPAYGQTAKVALDTYEQYLGSE